MAVSRAERPEAKPPGPLDTDRPWHAMSADAALAALDTGPQGLTSAEATRRRARFGPNELPHAKGPSLAVIFVRQFKNPLIYLLLAAALVSVVTGHAGDAAFIFIVLLINAIVGTTQEYQAARSAAALDALVRQAAVVHRDGMRMSIDSADLVPGDIVDIESGVRVPADLRLLTANDLRIDESLLTGESLPVEKDARSRLDPETPLGDRATMVHAGSSVLAGRGTGVVVRTGHATELGQIAQALATTEAPPPPLLVRLARFTRALGIAIVAAIAVLAVIQLSQGTPLAAVFFFAVALAVSAIPEGMPVAISVALAIAARRMARVNVIVRGLPAVEGLGACTMIATDKTGTLTVNQLTAKTLWLSGIGTLTVEGQGYVANGHVLQDGAALAPDAAKAARRLAEAGALCNEASWRAQPGEGPVYVGDTVDVAFLVLAAKLGIDPEALRAARPATAFIPFESERRFSAGFYQADGGLVAAVKGAAEVILPMCAGLDTAALSRTVTELASQGYRVIAVAAGRVAGSAPEDLRGLDFLGFVGLIDPVRPEVPDAIAKCRTAGVDVVMVTGDHPATALAIGRQLGMAHEREEVITGTDLAHLAGDPARFDAAVAKAKIFARVEPAQKLAIVQSLQRAGHFVAVTGDGVNDAPALQAADIGVAMGRSGTDVARSAGDLVLTDDNFASIVAGIEQGRAAYDNVRKVILQLVATGAAEIVIFFLAQFLGYPLPLVAVQLLWLNLVTNGIQDVALAFEAGEPGALTRPPRPPDQPIFDRRMIEATILSGAYMGGVSFAVFAWLIDSGWSVETARNVLLLLMVSFENAMVLSVRSETRSIFRVPFRANPFVVLAVVAAQGVHIAAMHIPGLSDVLQIAPVSLQTWATTAVLALSLIAVIEIYKYVRRHTDRYAYT